MVFLVYDLEVVFVDADLKVAWKFRFVVLEGQEVEENEVKNFFRVVWHLLSRLWFPSTILNTLRRKSELFCSLAKLVSTAGTHFMEQCKGFAARSSFYG